MIKNSLKQYEPLPEQFASIEEAAAFWDTHDSADYETLMYDVDCKVNIKQRIYMDALDNRLAHKVEQ